MAKNASAILTDIKPREVSLVDSPANESEFLIVKNSNGALTKVKKEKQQTVLKSIEVKPFTINFSKYEYPTEQACIDYLVKNGVDVEGIVVKENDWEYKFVVNDESLFEGSSLAYGSWMPISYGIDSIIGIMKSVTGEVSKKGAKISTTTLSTLKDVLVSLDIIVKDAEGEKEENVSKENKVKKIDEEKTPEVEGAEKTPKTEGTVEAPADVEKPADAPAAEEKPADAPAAEATPTEEAPVEKAEELIKKAIDGVKKELNDKIDGLNKENTELKKKVEAQEKDEKITELQKRIADLEEAPGEGKGDNDSNTTEEPVAKKKSLFHNII